MGELERRRVWATPPVEDDSFRLPEGRVRATPPIEADLEWLAEHYPTLFRLKQWDREIVKREAEAMQREEERKWKVQDRVDEQNKWTLVFLFYAYWVCGLLLAAGAWFW